MTVPVPTLLTGSQNGSNLTVYTTASVTAAQNDLLLVFTQFIGGTRTVTVSSTTGGALPAFTKAVEAWWNTVDEMGCHWVVVPTGGFTGTLDITGSGGGNQCHWSVIKIAAGTFNPTTPIPQTNTATGTGTSFTAALGAAVNTDSRTFCMAGHLVFEGQGVGANMTEFHDSPGNSGGSPLGRGYSSAWRSDAFETNPTLTGTTSAAWGFLCVELAGAVAAGNNYSDTVDTVIVSVQANSDVAARVDTLDHLGLSSQANTDTAQRVDTPTAIAVVVMQNSDVAARVDTLDHLAISSQQNSDVAAYLAILDQTGVIVYTVVDSTGGNFTDILDHLIVSSQQNTDTAQRVDTPTAIGVVVLQNTDTAQRSDVLSPVLVTVVTATDTLAIQETLGHTVVGLYDLIDAYVDSSIPPFVILVGIPQTRWSFLALKQRFRVAVVTDQSEDA